MLNLYLVNKKLQSYRRNFQFRQVKYMLFNVNIGYDSKLSKGSHQVLAESHQKDLPTKSTFFSYSWAPNKQGESK